MALRLFLSFVDPLSRSGPKVNCVGRLLGSEADLLTDEDWAIYHLNFNRLHDDSGVRFGILP